MGTFLIVFKTVGMVFKLISLGEKIYEIFHPDKVNISTLISDMENAIQEILHQELTQAAIEDAEGVLQNATDFINTEYYNAIQSGESDEDIWDLLTTGDGGQRLNDIQNQMGVMDNWSLDKDETVQTLPVYMLLTGVCLSLYQARARYAPSDTEKQANISNIVSYAKTYASRISDIINWIQPQRVQAVKPVKYEDSRSEYYFRDGWIDNNKMLKAAWSYGADCQYNPDQVQQLIENLQSQHLKLLQSGAESDFTTMWEYANTNLFSMGPNCPESVVGDMGKYFGSSNGNWPPTDGYVFQIVDFGAMLTQSQQILSYLSNIENNPLPNGS